MSSSHPKNKLRSAQNYRQMIISCYLYNIYEQNIKSLVKAREVKAKDLNLSVSLLVLSAVFGVIDLTLVTWLSQG